MILRDIDMDLPYIIDEEKVQMTPEETRKDYELNWKWKRRDFQLTNRCMMAMITRLMPRIVTEKCWKITIQCVEKISKDGYIIVGGDCEIQVIFDLGRFYSMTRLEKKQYAIEKTMEGLNKLIPFIDVTGVLEACYKVVESNYENIWFWKKPKKRKNLSVQLKVVHDSDFITFYMVFADSKTKESEEFFMAKDEPSEWIFNNYFGILEWIDDTTAKLTTKDGKEFIKNCVFKASK